MLARIICAILTLIALGGALFFEYWYQNAFWCNVCLALFGSALLTYINALISYKTLRRELIMRYLTNLRRYRQKFKYLQAAGENERKSYLEDISDFFYELHSDYSQIQHLRKKFFTHESISFVLDFSFQKILEVQSELNTGHFELVRQKTKVDESADMIEEFAQRKKYLKSPKREGNDNGQGG